MIDIDKLDAAALELACLHRQVTTRRPCPHAPRHESVGDAIVRRYAASSPLEVQRRIRAACFPRNA